MTDFEKSLILDMDTASRCSLVLIKIGEMMELADLLEEKDLKFMKKVVTIMKEAPHD